MSDVDERIRTMARPIDLDESHRDRLWDAARAQFSATEPARLTSRARRSRRSLRPVAIALAVVLVTGSVAVGASAQVRSAVGDVAVDALDVFRGQDRDEPLAPEAERLVDRFEGGPRGGLRLDQGRTLASSTRNGITGTLSAIPSGRDGLCLAVNLLVDGIPPPDGDTLACIGPLNVDRPIGSSGSIRDRMKVLAGITLDDVTQVEINVDGQWEVIEMNDHAFVWIAPSRDAVSGPYRVTFSNDESVIQMAP